MPQWARDSPDRLIYGSNLSGKWEVYAWDRGAGARRKVTDRPDGTTNARIDPTGEWIWWFDDTRGSELGRWKVERFGGGDLTDPAPALRPGYSGGLALGLSSAVVGLSTDSGSQMHLLRPGLSPQMFYSHREDAQVAGFDREENLLAIEHSEHGDSRHPALRVIGEGGRRVGDLWDGPGLGLEAGSWSPVPGDRRLLIVHERRGTPRPAIWAPEAADVTEIEADLPGEMSASWYPSAASLLVAHDHRGRTELYRYDIPTRELSRIDLPPGTIEAARVRPEGEVWYAWSSGASPPELRLGTDTLPVGEPAPGGAAYSDLEVNGVHGFLARPDGSPPYPTILVVHGGPAYHDPDGFAPRVQAWVDHGFAVALVNYRGSTGYGRAWRDALEASPGLTELEDVAAIRDHLVAEGLADPERLVLSGASWGGYLTLLGLGTQPERWSLGIAAVPVADYVAAFEDEMEPLKAFDRALFGGTPAERPEFYGQRSPITFVEQVRVPVMILAGRNDPRCPIRQIENYVGRLDQLGKPHQVYRYDAGHSSMVVEETIRQLEAQLAFASHYLATQPPL
jgi:dienelactone hydrolase